ncbi:MAG: Purple acid phosphatase [Myxococcaceae bacterium]|nr:Purple acid phosphatase [Myxococcaceae bacterium]
MKPRSQMFSVQRSRIPMRARVAFDARDAGILARLASVSALVIALFCSRNAAAATFKKGPWLQDLDATSVVVRAEVEPASPVKLVVERVKRAAGPGDAKTALGPATTFHSLRVTGLEPQTAYRYSIESSGTTENGTFTTAPSDTQDAPISFLLYGDNRTDDVSHAAVVRTMAESPSDFLINTGDAIEDGNDREQWQRFFEIEKGLLKDRCLFIAVGNHELKEEAGTNFLRYFGTEAAANATPERSDRRRLYRTVRWGATRFFLLNGLDTFVSGAEKEWLDAELARADNEPGLSWRIVVVHHGAWAAGPHGPNPRLMAAHAPDMWKAHQIDLVLSGHDHIYERGESNGLKYIVSGGGGAPLYRVRGPNDNTRMVESTFHFLEAKIDGTKVSIVAKRLDGSLMDRCSFTKGAPWDCAAPAAAGGAATQVMPVKLKPTSDGDPTMPVKQSRCGCSVPGAPSTSWGAFGALAALSACLIRRGRHA